MFGWEACQIAGLPGARCNLCLRVAGFWLFETVDDEGGKNRTKKKRKGDEEWEEEHDRFPMDVVEEHRYMMTCYHLSMFNFFFRWFCPWIAQCGVELTMRSLMVEMKVDGQQSGTGREEEMVELRGMNSMDKAKHVMKLSSLL